MYKLLIIRLHILCRWFFAYVCALLRQHQSFVKSIFRENSRTATDGFRYFPWSYTAINLLQLTAYWWLTLLWR